MSERRDGQRLRAWMTSALLASLAAASCTEPLGLGSEASDEVTVRPAVSGQSLNPNEPAAFAPIAEHDLSCIPGTTGCTALAGEWAYDDNSSFSIVDDTTAPRSPETVGEILFPQGLDDGFASVRFEGWGPSIDHGGANDYRQLYVSFWMKIRGSDYENQTGGTRIFYLAYGSTGRINHSGFVLRGNGSQSIVTEMPLEYSASEMNSDGTDPGGGAAFYSSNESATQFSVGQWHQVELWLKINDIEPTQANGEVKWWLDGELLGHHTGFRFRSDSNPKGFYNLRIATEWGGNDGDIRSRDDYWELDHLYVSGVSFDPHPNEPEGFSRIAEHNLSCVPGDAGCSAPAGEWATYLTGSQRDSANFSIVVDSTAPRSPDQVAEIRFPAAFDDGYEPARFDGWGPGLDPSNGSHDYSQLYVSFWLRIRGSDYQNQSGGTKILYIAYGSTSRQNHSGFILRGEGSQSIVTSMPLQYFVSEMNLDGTDPGGGASFYAANEDQTEFGVGEWHQVELWMNINDTGPTQANGELKWWLDGELQGHHTGFRFRSDINPKAFYHLQVTPIYGGNSGDIRTRNDYWTVDNMYISAAP